MIDDREVLEKFDAGGPEMSEISGRKSARISRILGPIFGLILDFGKFARFWPFSGNFRFVKNPSFGKSVLFSTKLGVSS